MTGEKPFHHPSGNPPIHSAATNHLAIHAALLTHSPSYLFLPPYQQHHNPQTGVSTLRVVLPVVMADEGTPLRLSLSTSATTAASSISNTPGGGGTTPIRRPSFLLSKPPPPPPEESETAAKKTSKAVKLAIYVFGTFVVLSVFVYL